MNKNYKIDANFTSFDDEDFELIITDKLNTSLQFIGVSRKILEEKTRKVYETITRSHGIYILEGNDKLYVGQSKKLEKRIDTHKYTDTINFTRCFALVKKDNLGAYLDYMEAYTYNAMKKRGYNLEQKEIKIENQPVSDDEKEIAVTFADEFLALLPILGFRKSTTQQNYEKVILENEKQTDDLNNKSKNKKYQIDLKVKTIRESILDFIEFCGLEDLVKNHSQLFNSKVFIRKNDSKQPFVWVNKKPSRIVKIKNDTYYLWVHSSNADLRNLLLKIAKIKDISLNIIES